FVPGNRLNVVPARLIEKRMNSGPSDLGIPKPQCCERGGLQGPSLHVRPVPIHQATWPDGVAMKPPDTIRAVTDNCARGWPRCVSVSYVPVVQVELATHGDLLAVNEPSSSGNVTRG